MPSKRVGPPAQKLAGKGAEEPVMRNGIKRTSRPGDCIAPDTESQTSSIQVLDECPRRKQRLEALAGANDIRFDIARVRRELHSGELDFDLFLDETPASCAKVQVLKLLTWLPNIGRVKARRIVGCIPTEDMTPPMDMRVGELTARAKYHLSGRVGPLLESHARTYRDSS